MEMGARSTDQWREHRALLEAISRNREEAAPLPAPEPIGYVEDEPAPRPRLAARDRLLGLGVALLAALWIAALATGYEAGGSPILALAERVSLASGPLALLGIAWLLVQRTSRREAARFGETSRGMRAEAANLEEVVGQLSARIDDNRKALAEHAQQLLLLGEDSTLRLAEIGAEMKRETASLAAQADRLEGAAANARADMVALADELPPAEARIQGLSALLREAGLSAHEQAVALEAQLASLAARGREADEHAGGAAQRLSAHLARIDATSETAGKRIESAATRMAATVDGALAGTAQAIESTRAGVEAQAAAMRALVDESAAALSRAGAESAEALGGRLDAISERIEALATRLAAQGEASELLLGALDRSLGEIEARFADVGVAGDASTARLGAAIDALRSRAIEMAAGFEGGSIAADALIARADALGGALAASTQALDGALPDALARVEAQADRGRSAIARALPEAERLGAAAGDAAGRLSEAEAAVARQRDAVDAIATEAVARLDAIRGEAEALDAALAQTRADAEALADGAGQQLVDALLRVRETAVQSAARAREAIGAVIPDAAQAMGERLDAALAAGVEERLARVGAAAEAAVEAAARAGEQLEARIATLSVSHAEVERRIDEGRAEAAKGDDESFARRVALLIESLNSTAIDVTKILSNEVTDSAWMAYLKGDRSVFTRRAVRLVDAADIKEIQRHYDAEPEFRAQVNRYIHDFEGMLRRVLSSRDGAPLGVTLLSADMGKLYVALAQAIERLRA